MSIQLSCQNGDTDVPQPVKKRGRFSSRGTDITSQLEEQLPELSKDKNNISQMFVRDELDEYNSAEDEDYMAHLAEDEYMLDEDDQEEFEFISEFEEGNRRVNTQDRQTELRSSGHINSTAIQTRVQASSSAFGNPPTAHTPSSRENGPDLSSFHFSHDADIAHFEVDDLESTDEEDSYAADTHPTSSKKSLPPHFQREVLDEESDDENEVHHAEESSEDEEDEDEEGNVQETERDYYAEFLKELVTEDVSHLHGLSNRDAENNTLNAESRQADAEARATISRILDEDDDFDFDYLKESANVQEDPLEYRHDFHVPRREVVQLLFTESSLRPQTRTAKPRKLQVEKSVDNNSNRAIVATPLVPTPLAAAPAPISSQSAPLLSQLQQQVIPSQAIPSNRLIAGESQGQVTYGPGVRTNSSITTAHINQFKEQLAIFTQLLTYVHADVTRKISSEDQQERPSSEAEPEASTDVVTLKEASKKSETLLRRLVRSKRISNDYHEMLSSQMAGLAPFYAGVTGVEYHNSSGYVSARKTIYNLASIDLIEKFLDSCNTVDSSFAFTEVLKPFEPYNREWVSKALCKKRPRRQYSSSGSRKGWFAWTAEDDKLLAITIGKYGRDVGDFSKDLLPHREEDDCQTRVRYLSSRRCPDNAVKRQVMHISAPLRKEELKLVEIGLQQFSHGNPDEPEVWKCIQRHLLPHRDWSHLQKLWGWREAKRKYKAKYRSKAKEKKKAPEKTQGTRT